MDVRTMVFNCFDPYVYPYAKVSYDVQRDIIALYGLGLHDFFPMHGD
jgi:hypothetical protein